MDYDNAMQTIVILPVQDHILLKNNVKQEVLITGKSVDCQDWPRPEVYKNTLRRCFSRSSRKQEGTTSRFILSYGAGMPSYTFNLLKASLPRCNL